MLRLYNKIIDEDSDEAELDDTSSSKKPKACQMRKCKNNKTKETCFKCKIFFCVGNALIAYTRKYYVRILQTKFWKDYC